MGSPIMLMMRPSLEKLSRTQGIAALQREPYKYMYVYIYIYIYCIIYYVYIYTHIYIYIIHYNLSDSIVNRIIAIFGQLTHEAPTNTTHLRTGLKPHKHKDPTCWFKRLKTRGIPDTMLCRIPSLWRSERLSADGQRTPGSHVGGGPDRVQHLIM